MPVAKSAQYHHNWSLSSSIITSRPIGPTVAYTANKVFDLADRLVLSALGVFHMCALPVLSQLLDRPYLAYLCSSLFCFGQVAYQITYGGWGAYYRPPIVL